MRWNRQPLRQCLIAHYPNYVQGLSDHAADAFTLDSFIDFLSENHCIELLDFLSDGKTYIDAYRASVPDLSTRTTSDSRRLGRQWKVLMSTYIIPGAPDEINIPETIRSRLLDQVDVMVSPPNPTLLEPAINYAHELLTESALLPFIQSIRSFGYQNNRNSQNNYISRGNQLSQSSETQNNNLRNPHADSEGFTDRGEQYVGGYISATKAQPVSNNFPDREMTIARSQGQMLMNQAFSRHKFQRMS